jgi:hypothetical protein
MEPFTFKHGQAPWPTGLTLPHVYVVPDVRRNPALAQLVADCRAAVPVEPLSHVPDRWLHITLAQIAVPAPEVSVAQRAALAVRLRKALASVAPFTVMVGDPSRVPTGILFSVDDSDGRLEDVRRRVVSEASVACGPGTPLAGHLSPLHMTESYARGHADDGRVDRALKPIQRRVPLPVSSVLLAEVAVDQVTKSVTWSTITRIPLRGGREG